MRQKVLARMFWSSIAAMKTAAISCGTLESRKMLKVLRSADPELRVAEDGRVLVEPDELPELRTRSQSMKEITAVYPIGKSPTTRNRMKNGEM
jgi:hypothetical protein